MLLHTILELRVPSFALVRVISWIVGYVCQVERSTKSHELTRIETDNTSTF